MLEELLAAVQAAVIVSCLVSAGLCARGGAVEEAGVLIGLCLGTACVLTGGAGEGREDGVARSSPQLRGSGHRTQRQPGKPRWRYAGVSGGGGAETTTAGGIHGGLFHAEAAVSGLSTHAVNDGYCSQKAATAASRGAFSAPRSAASASTANPPRGAFLSLAPRNKGRPPVAPARGPANQSPAPAAHGLSGGGGGAAAGAAATAAARHEYESWYAGLSQSDLRLVDAANDGVRALLTTVGSRRPGPSGGRFAEDAWVVNTVDERLRLAVSSRPGAPGQPRLFKVRDPLRRSRATFYGALQL